VFGRRRVTGARRSSKQSGGQRAAASIDCICAARRQGRFKVPRTAAASRRSSWARAAAGSRAASRCGPRGARRGLRGGRGRLSEETAVAEARRCSAATWVEPEEAGHGHSPNDWTRSSSSTTSIRGTHRGAPAGPEEAGYLSCSRSSPQRQARSHFANPRAGSSTFLQSCAHGRHKVAVCMGTAAISARALVLERLERELAVSAGATTADRRFTLETVAAGLLQPRPWCRGQRRPRGWISRRRPDPRRYTEARRGAREVG